MKKTNKYQLNLTLLETAQGETVLILILGALIALSPFSIDMYLPAFPAIAKALHTDIAQVGYSLTSYYAGLCVGQLIYGVLIDRFGRKKPLMAGLLLYLIAAVGCSLAGGVHYLVAVRLLMALGGCVGMVASRAVVRDFFAPAENARILSQLVLVMGVAPVIAPTIGGLVNSYLGWRWVFGVMGVIACMLMIAVARWLPETKTADALVSLRMKEVGASYWQVLQNKTFLMYTLAGGVSYAGMYAYIAGSPFVFMEKYHFTDTAYSWAFGWNACGLIAGSQLNRLALKKYSSAFIARQAAILLFVAGLALLVITYTQIAGATVILCCTFLFLLALGFINPNTTALALQPFTQAAGRASAVLGSLQMIAGVVASWLVSYLHNGTAVIMPAVMFGCTVLCVTLLWQKPKQVAAAVMV
ncbi:MFS transporter, DHA1 family, bicyclomycin/chloramphenicol resistance protein [Filimonas lacunae]|uniref:MFS transporter, DHA1 family, bicyclomycin/chloramphenicol resistance protein n=1 Tax=Filimonas lacunae TaxID=477680 RepID=A0A173MFB5_9BACT|nr:multidrug effflux MFS transporter [Filimonas lacunae]BAV06197.1 multidrug resistance transporter, Bcr/CflA family [Filimonas lacunae]SIT25224.1 MFS transporter, DHA1 family, bicyclomycin/chloramphenicol resistance protein [Filimonas lacunae]